MKVLVFGSLNIDYVYSVNHFVRPGETLSADDRQIFSGGKGLNQAIAFAKYLILNEIEAAAILKETGAALAENADGTALLNGLVHKFPDSKIVLTLGKEGSMYGYHTKRCAQGIFPVKTVDTTAAGDTFTGYFVGEIINGKTPEEALKTAAMASAIAVGKKGASTSIPTLAEVRDSL